MHGPATLNRVAIATEDRLLKRLFAIMEQLRRNDRAFLDALPTLKAMGVPRLAPALNDMGPPSPRANTGFPEDDPESAAVRDLEELYERRLKWIRSHKGSSESK
jgi:hypothetical protein